MPRSIHLHVSLALPFSLLLSSLVLTLVFWSLHSLSVCLSAWKSACLSDCPPVLLVCHSQSQNSINNYNAKCLFIIRLPVPNEFSCFPKSALLISHAKPLPCSVTLSFLISASVCQSDSNFSLSKSSSVSVYLPAFVFVILSLLLSVSLTLISLSVWLCFLCQFDSDFSASVCQTPNTSHCLRFFIAFCFETSLRPPNSGLIPDADVYNNSIGLAQRRLLSNCKRTGNANFAHRLWR